LADVWACGGRRLDVVGGRQWSELHYKLVERFALYFENTVCIAIWNDGGIYL